MAMTELRSWTAGYFVMMLTMWIVMMIGMMVPSVVPMVLIYAGVFSLTHDLDRPLTGVISVTQEPMRALKISLEKNQ
jgi:predicted metal-binding membrane protein